jgi:hypothetical protein
MGTMEQNTESSLLEDLKYTSKYFYDVRDGVFLRKNPEKKASYHIFKK